VNGQLQAATTQVSVSQTVAQGRLPGSFRRKSIAKIVSDAERSKIHPFMSVRELPLLVDLQQKAGDLVLSITCPTIIILENTLN
jgi:hypothetical protein